MATKKSTAKKTSAKSSAVSQATKQQRVALKLINDNIDNVQVVAKKTYLASLGVVGKSYEEIKTRYAKTNKGIQARYQQINVDGQNLVKELVVRGEKVQDEAGDMIKESRASVEDQIETAKKRLGGFVSLIDVPARLQDVSNKLESLSKDLKKSA